MRYVFFTLLVVGLWFPHIADARPVSYPSGWTVMTMNDGMRDSVHIHYSPTAKLSIGYKYEHWQEMDFTLHGLQVNNLLKRWNKRDSQANLYLKSGLGKAYSNADNPASNNELAAFTGIAADWEDRRYFVSYQSRYTYAGDIGEFFQQSARVGWAPYEGDYGDLHTWLMLQVDHTPESDDNLTVTPLD